MLNTMMTRSEKRAETIRAKKAHIARMAQLREEGLAIVADRKCPECGAGIHSNLAVTGWWQCDRFGAPGFRRNMTGAQCSWQVCIPSAI